MSKRPLPRCPHANCLADPVTYVKHSVLSTNQRIQRRYRCPACNSTFAANAGTPYHRMRYPPHLFDQVIALSVEGMSIAAIARATNVSRGTVARWIEKGAAFAMVFNDASVQEVDAVEVQSDELKVQAGKKGTPMWTYTAMEVWSRLWVTARVGRRTLRNTYLHFRDVKRRCRYSGLRVLISTDAFKYNKEVVARTFGNSCVYVQVEKRYRKGRVVRADKKLIIGPQWHLDEAMDRSEDSRTINTAYVERLNLTIRRSIACLQRKTTALCRSENSIRGKLELLRCCYNFIRPHGSLKFGREKRTPAQQAGLVSRRLTWRTIFTARLLGRPDRPLRDRMRRMAANISNPAIQC